MKNLTDQIRLTMRAHLDNDEDPVALKDLFAEICEVTETVDREIEAARSNARLTRLGQQEATTDALRNGADRLAKLESDRLAGLRQNIQSLRDQLLQRSPPPGTSSLLTTTALRTELLALERRRIIDAEVRRLDSEARDRLFLTTEDPEILEVLMSAAPTLDGGPTAAPRWRPLVSSEILDRVEMARARARHPETAATLDRAEHVQTVVMAVIRTAQEAMGQLIPVGSVSGGASGRAALEELRVGQPQLQFGE